MPLGALTNGQQFLQVGQPGASPWLGGIDIVVWTVDDGATMQSRVDAGIDGIITDYTDRLRQVMADNGLQRRAGRAAPREAPQRRHAGGGRCAGARRVTFVRALPRGDRGLGPSRQGQRP
jgi:hypothetical protein